MPQSQSVLQKLCRRVHTKQEFDVPTIVDGKYTNPWGGSANLGILSPSDRVRRWVSFAYRTVLAQSLKAAWYSQTTELRAMVRQVLCPVQNREQCGYSLQFFLLSPIVRALLPRFYALQSDLVLETRLHSHWSSHLYWEYWSVEADVVCPSQSH